MIRLKNKWQLRRKVGPYLISTINLWYRGYYLSMRDFCIDYSQFTFGELMKYCKEVTGFYETMVFDGESWIEQVRYKSRFRAQIGHKEMIKKYENMYNNSKEK